LVIAAQRFVRKGYCWYQGKNAFLYMAYWQAITQGTLLLSK